MRLKVETKTPLLLSEATPNCLLLRLLSSSAAWVITQSKEKVGSRQRQEFVGHQAGQMTTHKSCSRGLVPICAFGGRDIVEPKPEGGDADGMQRSAEPRLDAISAKTLKLRLPSNHLVLWPHCTPGAHHDGGERGGTPVLES